MPASLRSTSLRSSTMKYSGLDDSNFWSANAGTSFRRLSRVWYISCTPSRARITKPSRFPSGTSVTVWKSSFFQKSTHGSIASTKSTGVRLLNFIVFLLTIIYRDGGFHVLEEWNRGYGVEAKQDVIPSFAKEG